MHTSNGAARSIVTLFKLSLWPSLGRAIRLEHLAIVWGPDYYLLHQGNARHGATLSSVALSGGLKTVQ